MKAFFILSIVAPISLMTAFRLTGLVAGPMEPVEPRTFTVEPVEWVQERPVSMIGIKDTVQNVYQNGNLLVVFNVIVDDFDYTSLYGGSDVVSVIAVGTADIHGGSVETARVVFRESFKPSEVHFGALPAFLHDSTLRNLSFSEYAATDLFESKLTNDTKAFLTVVGENTPDTIYFSFPAKWVLRSASNQSHSLEAALELTYRTELASERVILPIKIDLLVDDNNSFETAAEIKDGNYTRLYIGGADVRDYYKVHRTAGQQIRLSADSSAWLWEAVPYFTLYLYDPQQNQMAAADQHPHYMQRLEFLANSTGYWYIEVRIDGSGGFYSLVISQ